MDEYIKRETALSLVQPDAPEDEKAVVTIATAKKLVRSIIQRAPAVDVEKISDGYHTFADLYEQRLILSAALAKNNPHAWKSKRHEDGSVPFGGGWFIMGFDTDEGCYTYHYELKDWDLFQCKELNKGKPWDGHTSKDVRRLLSIPSSDVEPVKHGEWEWFEEWSYSTPDHPAECDDCGWRCSKCKTALEDMANGYYDDSCEVPQLNYCPNCGAKMDGDDNSATD